MSYRIAVSENSTAVYKWDRMGSDLHLITPVDGNDILFEIEGSFAYYKGVGLMQSAYWKNLVNAPADAVMANIEGVLAKMDRLVTLLDAFEFGAREISSTSPNPDVYNKAHVVWIDDESEYRLALGYGNNQWYVKVTKWEPQMTRVRPETRFNFDDLSIRQLAGQIYQFFTDDIVEETK